MELLNELYKVLTSYVSPTILWGVLTFIIIKKFTGQIFKMIRFIVLVTFIICVAFNVFSFRDMLLDMIGNLF